MADRRALIASLVHTLLVIAALTKVSAAQKRRDVDSPNKSERMMAARLLEDKTSHPNKYLIPSNFVNVSVSMSLNNILSVRPKRGEIELVAWITFSWTDSSLAWKSSSPSKVALPSSLVWKPDVVPYGATKPVEYMFPTNVVVMNTGKVTWVPSTKMTLSCDVNNYKTGSECKTKFGPWVYDAASVDVHTESDQIDLSNFSSPGFTVLSSKAKRVVSTYACCPESYSSIEFSFKFRKS